MPRIVLLSWAPIGGDAGETATIEEGLRTLGYAKGWLTTSDGRASTSSRWRRITASTSGRPGSRRRSGIAGGPVSSTPGPGAILEEAREPGYLETKKGRVALISVSSGNKSHEWAGLPKAGLRGRPGVNPLRVSMKYLVGTDGGGRGFRPV